MVWSDSSSARWQGIDPRLEEVLSITRERTGIPFEISEGRRSEARQRQMVDQGKSQTMNSEHRVGGAVDINIPDGQGGVDWEFEAYRPIADMAKTVAGELGYDDLVWGGDWKTLKDGVHFQMAGGDQMAGDDQMPVGDFLDNFDRMLQGGGQMQGGAGADELAMLRAFSPTQGQRTARAMGNISDRLISYGRGTPLPSALRGDVMFDRQRSKHSRNQTAKYLKSQGRDMLANMVLNGELKGADLMSVLAAGNKDKRTALQQNYEYAINNLGMDPENARKWVQSGNNITIGGDSKIGAVPKGYSVLEDKSNPSGYRLEKIPGGEPEADEIARKAKAAGAAETAEGTANMVTGAIDQIRTTMEGADLPTTGLGGWLTKQIPGTAGYDVSQTLQTIKGNIAFDTLAKMRANSPSGGALGAINTAELQLLQDNMAALEQSQSKEQFLKNLKIVEDQYNKVLITPGEGATVGATGGGGTGKHLLYDPATGVFTEK